MYSQTFPVLSKLLRTSFTLMGPRLSLKMNEREILLYSVCVSCTVLGLNTGQGSQTHLRKALNSGKEALVYSTHWPSEGSSVSWCMTLVLLNRLKEENLRTDTCLTSESAPSSCFCLST